MDTTHKKKKKKKKKGKKSQEGGGGNALNILVLGETGSGKSTFINTITNFFRKGSLKALKISIPTKYLKKTEEFEANEFDIANTTTSKTDSCNLYKFSFKGTTYNFIDTPGLSDTRGTKKDDENLDKIIDAAEHTGYLNAIVIVINGTTPRLTVNLQNVFARLKGCVPDVLFSNLLVVFTNCLQHTCNFDIKSLGALVPKAQFYMNNSAFSSNPKKWDETALAHLNLEWTSSMKEIEQATKMITTMAVTTTTAFLDMKNIRFDIKQTLHGVRLQINKLQELQDHLNAAQTALGKYSNDADQFKNYTSKKTMKVTSLVDAPYHSTICSTCNSVCHDHCGLNEISTKGSNSFTGCSAMNGNNCRVCTGQCSYTTHYHARKTMKTVDQTIDEVLHDMKAKHDTASQGKSTQMQQITSTKSAKAAVEQAIASTSAKLNSKCQELKKICSGFNLVDELHAMLAQLETEARNLVSMDARTSADNFIRTIRQLCDSLSKQQHPTAKPGAMPQITGASSDEEDSDEEDSDSSGSKQLPPKPIARTWSETSSSCKMCNGPLEVLSYSEREWYLSRDLAIPKTCKTCKSNKTKDEPTKKQHPNSSTKSKPVKPPSSRSAWHDEDDHPHAPSRRPHPPPSSPSRHHSHHPPAPASYNNSSTTFCKVCGMAFALGETEREWFTSRNIPPPRTCKPCRDKNKAT